VRPLRHRCRATTGEARREGKRAERLGARPEAARGSRSAPPAGILTTTAILARPPDTRRWRSRGWSVSTLRPGAGSCDRSCLRLL